MASTNTRQAAAGIRIGPQGHPVQDRIAAEVLSPQRGIAGHFWTHLVIESVQWLVRKEILTLGFGLLLVSACNRHLAGAGQHHILAAVSSVDPTLYERPSSTSSTVNNKYCSIDSGTLCRSKRRLGIL